MVSSHLIRMLLVLACTLLGSDFTVTALSVCSDFIMAGAGCEFLLLVSPLTLLPTPLHTAPFSPAFSFSTFSGSGLAGNTRHASLTLFPCFLLGDTAESVLLPSPHSFKVFLGLSVELER